MVTFTTIDVSGTAPARRVAVQIGGVSYDLRFRWLARAERWVVDLFAADGSPIVTGTGASASWMLWRWFYGPRRPAGEIFFFDSTATGAPIAFDDFSNGRIAVCVVEA